MAEVNDNGSIQLFEDQKIRTAWDAEKEEWYFAIVDVIAVLTDSADPQNYWRVLKKRLKDEGNETITNCNGLKMTAPDGKKRKTDVANTEQLLRIIQSIPSPKAEPFKAWLAMVGKERIEETIDPEQAIDRALDTYLKKCLSVAIQFTQNFLGAEPECGQVCKFVKEFRPDLLGVRTAGIEVPCKLVEIAAHLAALSKQSGNSGQGYCKFARSV